MRDAAGLILAAASSVLLHGAALGVLAWSPGVAVEAIDAPLLQARLVTFESLTPAPAAPKQPERPTAPEVKPRQAAAPKPVPHMPDVLASAGVEVAEFIPLAEPAPEPEPVAPDAADLPPKTAEPRDPPAAEPGAAPPELPGASLAAWPARGSIRFQTHLGEGGFLVGEATHEWWHDGERYRMSVELETTGVVGIFQNFRYVQRSEGRVGPQGLQPETFSVEQTRKKPSSVSFDWTARQVTITRGSRVKTAEIAPGDQDVLSLWHQIGIVGVARGALALNVVSGSEATASTVTIVGGERVKLPIGELDTLRIRAAANDGKLTIDLWLASAYGMLPVRIRAVDDKGEVLDQRAVELKLMPSGGRSANDADAGPGLADMIELRAERDPFAQLNSGN